MFKKMFTEGTIIQDILDKGNKGKAIGKVNKKKGTFEYLGKTYKVVHMNSFDNQIKSYKKDPNSNITSDLMSGHIEEV